MHINFSKNFPLNATQCTQVDQDAKADTDYVKTFCWAHGTYTISKKTKEEYHLYYYQWVPVVLAVQAFFFQLPFLFWAQRSRASGLNLPTLMKGVFALTEVHKDASERNGTCKEVAAIMDCYFRRNLIYPKKSFRRWTTCNLTFCYFFSKILYLLNITLQMYFLNEFLHERFFENFHTVATRILTRKRAVEQSWKLFPLLAKCKFFNNMDDIPDIGETFDDDKRKEHLCTLPLNLYNDTLFASVGLLLIVMVFSVIWSTCQWAAMLFLPVYKDSLFKKVLREDVNHRHLRRRR